MADLFAKDTDNVLDVVNQDNSISDDFQGGFFDDAESNFLGIAIGKKARARKAAKRADRQAARKYKMETERIRALQGQPKESVVKDIATGISNVASSIFGGGKQIETTETTPSILEQQQAQQQPGIYSYPNPAPTKNNTVLYVIIGVAVIGAAFFLLKRK